MMRSYLPGRICHIGSIFLQLNFTVFPFDLIVYLRYTNAMAQNKKNEFDVELLELADFAKALSHPARLAILKELAQKNTCICGEIVNVIPLAQSTVSQHLKELKNAGIIGGEIDGPKSCYCINRAKLNEMSQCLMKLFSTLSENGCCQKKK